jgi:hypothetical protein
MDISSSSHTQLFPRRLFRVTEGAEDVERGMGIGRSQAKGVSGRNDMTKWGARQHVHGGRIGNGLKKESFRVLSLTGCQDPKGKGSRL